MHDDNITNLVAHSFPPSILRSNATKRHIEKAAISSPNSKTRKLLAERQINMELRMQKLSVHVRATSLPFALHKHFLKNKKNITKPVNNIDFIQDNHGVYTKN
jgi:hypothetical protein